MLSKATRNRLETIKSNSSEKGVALAPKSIIETIY